MTAIEGRNWIYTIIDKLVLDGFNICRKNIQVIKFIDDNDCCGYMMFSDVDKYELAININLLRDSKLNFFNCVVYHELAHIIQYNEAVSNKLIKYNKEDNTIDIICDDVGYADSVVFDNFHHTSFWQSIVNEFNDRYKLVPKVKAFLPQDELDTFLKEIFMTNRKRTNDPLLEPVISGLTMDDMMNRDVKPEYQIKDLDEDNLINEDYIVKHDYRKLLGEK